MNARILALFALTALTLSSAACFPLVSAPPRASSTTAAQVQPAPALPASPPRPEFEKSRADLDEGVAKAVQGYTKEGKPIAGTLDAFSRITLPLKRGKCYLGVLRLQEGATFSEQARMGTRFVFTGIDTGVARFNAGVEHVGSPGVVGPGGYASLGCPQGDSDGQFDLQTIRGTATDKSKVHDLGTGAFTFTLYAKSVSEQQLAANRHELEASLASSDAYKAQLASRQRQACFECRVAKTRCLSNLRHNYSACMHDYDMCKSVRSCK